MKLLDKIKKIGDNIYRSIKVITIMFVLLIVFMSAYIVATVFN